MQMASTTCFTTQDGMPVGMRFLKLTNSPVYRRDISPLYATIYKIRDEGNFTEVSASRRSYDLAINLSQPLSPLCWCWTRVPQISWLRPVCRWLAQPVSQDETVCQSEYVS